MSKIQATMREVKKMFSQHVLGPVLQVSTFKKGIHSYTLEIVPKSRKRGRISLIL